MDRKKRRMAGLLLRLAGLVLIGTAAAAGRALDGSAGMPGAAITVLDYLLALIAFISASAGSALVTVGPGLLDPVPLSSRWAAR